MSSSDGSNMWKIIQGLNGTHDANSLNETMCHDGRTITDIKSKANVFINHYTRVSKISMSQSNRDTNRQFRKRCNAPSVAIETSVPLLMDKLRSAIKRWNVKEQLVLTTFHLHFSHHSALRSSRNYYSYSTHHSHLLIAHESGGLKPSFHYSKLGNLLLKSPFSVPSVSCHVSSNFWNIFFLTVSTILPKPTTCSANSKPVFIKDGAVKIRLLK